MVSPFDRPIPGQSLTSEPGNTPWEQPPEMNTVEEVTKFYINKLANEDVIDDFAAMIQLGAPLAPIVETTYLQGVARGLHTVDLGMLVAPTIHMFLKQAIESLGITVKDEAGDPKKRAEAAELVRFQALALKYLEDKDEADPGIEMLSAMVEETPDAPEQAQEEETQVEEPEMEAPVEEAPKGLMARG